MDQSGFLIGPGILNNMVSKNDVGAVNGVAGLDSSGKVPTSQLPSSFSILTATYNSEMNDLHFELTTPQS